MWTATSVEINISEKTWHWSVKLVIIWFAHSHLRTKAGIYWYLFVCSHFQSVRRNLWTKKNSIFLSKICRASFFSFSLHLIQDQPLTITTQKMKFSIKDFFSKCDQIRRKLGSWSYLLKKSLMENFFFFWSECRA